MFTQKDNTFHAQSTVPRFYFSDPDFHRRIAAMDVALVPGYLNLKVAVPFVPAGTDGGDSPAGSQQREAVVVQSRRNASAAAHAHHLVHFPQDPAGDIQHVHAVVDKCASSRNPGVGEPALEELRPARMSDGCSEKNGPAHRSFSNQLSGLRDARIE